MVKALVKKQMLEVFAWLYQDKKTGKSRDKKGVITYLLLYIIVFGIVGVMFYEVAASLGNSLINGEFDWLYMAIMGMIGLIMGVFGSVFNTYASLYKVKDNDLLLSMPIPTKYIIFVRLLGVYAMGLLYELLVMVPTVILYLQKRNGDVVVIIFTILIPFVMSVLILAISCILGFLVGIISEKLKNQKIITVIMALIVFVAYYVLCGSAEGFLNMIVENPSNVASKVKGIFAIFYHLGFAANGNVNSMLIFTGITLVLFLVVYIILRKTFLKLTITNTGTKVKYVEKNIKTKSLFKSLLAKEAVRFSQSVTYMLNCGIGSVLMIVTGVVAIVKMDMILEVWKVLALFDYMDLVLIAGVCLISSMNNMAAVSISLEGKNIWILQSLPVPTFEIIKAKSAFQFIFTSIPTIFLMICMIFTLRLSMFYVVMMILIVLLFLLFKSLFDVACNLKFPNLTWTNETIAVKQSLSVAISLFGGLIFVGIFGGLYYLIYDMITASAYAIILTLILIALNIMIIMWLKKKGCKIFENL